MSINTVSLVSRPAILLGLRKRLSDIPATMTDIVVFTSSYSQDLEELAVAEVYWRPGMQIREMKDLIRKVAKTRSSCPWVVVHSGHNNLTNKKADIITSPEALSSKVASLLQVAKKNFPAAHAIFSALFPRVETELWPDPTALLKMRKCILVCNIL